MAFFATPHHGGHGVSVGDLAGKICRVVLGGSRNDIMEALRKDSTFAGGINADFTHRSGYLRVLNFIETQKISRQFGLVNSPFYNHSIRG